VKKYPCFSRNYHRVTFCDSISSEVKDHSAEMKQGEAETKPQPSQAKRFSRWGLIIGVIFAALTFFTIMLGPPGRGGIKVNTALIGLGGAGALILRSFRPPLGLGQGIATFVGGSFVGVGLFVLILASNANVPVANIIMPFAMATLLLWVGFRRK